MLLDVFMVQLLPLRVTMCVTLLLAIRDLELCCSLPLRLAIRDLELCRSVPLRHVRRWARRSLTYLHAQNKVVPSELSHSRQTM